jgi:Beta-galactosidase
MSRSTPIRMAILVFALGLPIACATVSLPPPPPTSGATFTVPARTPTPPTTPAAGPKLTRTVTPPSPPPTSGATYTAPALTLTPAIVPTSNTPAAPGLSLVTQPRGLTAVNNFEPSTRVGSLFDDRTYTNPNLAGLTFRTSWADVEPAQGNFVWTKLDTVFDNAEKNSKWVELVLIPGFGTPAWALPGVSTATFSVVYGPGKGDNLLLPLPWDQTYLNRWFAFLKAVSGRYQNRPSFIKIAADGPTSVTAEMSLPNAPADICTWVKVGYTSAQLIGAWQQVFANYAQIFPRQYFSLALYPPPPIVSTTRCKNGNPTGTDHNESQRVRGVMVGLGADNYPKQFVLQTNGLTAAKEDPSNSGAYALVKSYSGQVAIGFQLTTSAIMHPTNMGDPDGPTALQKSLQKGVDAHAQFLEVYEPDVLSPAAQDVLATFASALAP